MRPPRFSQAILTALAAMVLGAAGCNTYSYFEIDTKLDQLTFSNELSAQIHTCHVKVTGAATDDFYFQPRCPPLPTATQGRFDIGVIEYATFADSGTVNFQLQVFRCCGEVDKLGEGSVSLDISPGKTVMGSLKLIGIGTARP